MFLVDTNVISEIRQLQPSPRVIAWLNEFESELFFSAITLGELQAGISQLAEGRKKASLQGWFDEVRRKYRDVFLSFDENIAVKWGALHAELRHKGRPIPARDSFLAATALHHDLTIATRNEKDFAGTGARTVNPWNEPGT